ncbi:MAG: hypothetical protein AAFZ15_23280 [Bacteroidota bacterium]
MNFFLSLFLLIFIWVNSFAQNRTYEGSFLSINVSYLELKDEFNHGLVFRGPDIGLEYGIQRLDGKKYFEYVAVLGAGGKTTAGTWGFRWLLSPLNVHYSWKIKDGENFNLFIGPSARVNYNIQNYPELHTGPIIWMGNYDVGVQLSSFISIKKKLVELKLNTNAIGWQSRPEQERNPYYYSAGFGENFSDLHKNLELGGVDKFNQTTFEARLFLDKKNKARSISYLFFYTGYYDRPEFTEVFHAIKYTWFLNAPKS